MNALTRTTRSVTLAALLAVGIAGCSQARTPAPSPTSSPAPEVADCDAEDRRKNEVPDCGFTYNSKFYPWSWVKAGKKNPPAGWDTTDAVAEQAKVARPR